MCKTGPVKTWPVDCFYNCCIYNKTNLAVTKFRKTNTGVAAL